jgi:SPP1 gp7 family putative phage head morphogenesis protein
LGVSFNTVNENLIKEVIKTNWSGLEFSERIWNNRDKLTIKLKETLNKGLIRGDSLQDMSRYLANELEKDYNRALTLVHTETCYVQNQATVNSYKDAEIEEYEFLAFLDDRTTEDCRKKDGIKFKLSEAQAGVNLPPLHPRCRSAIIPVV